MSGPSIPYFLAANPPDAPPALPGPDPRAQIAAFRSAAPLPAPVLSPVNLSGPSAPPLPAPVLPQAAPNRVLTDQSKLDALRNSGPGVAQIHNPWTRGALRVADALGSVFLPGLSVAIPGTTIHHNLLVDQAQQNLQDDQDAAQKQAQTENLNLQPQLKQQAAQLNQDKLNEKTEHDQATVSAEQAKLDQQKHLQLARNGQMEVTGPDGQTHIVDDPDSQVYQMRQALTDYRGAQQELAEAQKAYKDAQTANLPLQMQQAQARIENAQRNASIAAGRLGLSQQEFQFHQDQFYNPQPTGAERKSADLAQSAVNQIHTLRSILAAHPEFQGPGGEARQAFTRWLSSKGEDAGKFLAAKDYLAEHSAGVFGGRGAYILQQLNDLTNGNLSPSTFGGVLDQAEDTATHFVKAGTVHGKPADASGGSGQADYVFVPGKGLVKQ